jgi:hypothetical protein
MLVRPARGLPSCAVLDLDLEIERVRVLIGRIREAMGELEPDERAEFQAFLHAERTSRSAILERLPACCELGRVGGVQAHLGEREILALRDWLRNTIRERSTGT